MKLFSIGVLGGVLGLIIGCNLIAHADASPSSKWEGCSERMIHAGESMVRVHDCN